MRRDSAGQPVLNQVESRGGFRDRPVAMVLGVSLALAAIVLGAVWFGMFGH